MTANLCGAGRVITVDFDDNRVNKALGWAQPIRSMRATRTSSRRLRLSPRRPGRGRGNEAVGVPQTFETCTKIVRPYGNIANAGVHGKPVELPLNTMWFLT